MRHRKSGLKLNRTSSHRNAMFRNMVTSLLKHERIRTTDAKAKELRRWADHLITLAKQGDLHARRQALSIVREKQVVHKLFEEAPTRYAEISGGYTRVVKLGTRSGDAAPISLVELVAKETISKKTKKKPAKAKGAPKKAAEAATAARPAESPASGAEAAPAEESQPAVETQPAAEPESEEKAAEPETEEAVDLEAQAGETEETEAAAPETEAETSKKKETGKTEQKAEDES